MNNKNYYQGDVKNNSEAITRYLELFNTANEDTPSCHAGYLIGKAKYCKRMLNDTIRELEKLV